MKKLTLNRESLRQLDAGESSWVAAGGVIPSLRPGPDCNERTIACASWLCATNNNCGNTSNCPPASQACATH